jgi:hypothetical protein
MILHVENHEHEDDDNDPVHSRGHDHGDYHDSSAAVNTMIPFAVDKTSLNTLAQPKL